MFSFLKQFTGKKGENIESRAFSFSFTASYMGCNSIRPDKCKHWNFSYVAYFGLALNITVRCSLFDQRQQTECHARGIISMEAYFWYYNTVLINDEHVKNNTQGQSFRNLIGPNWYQLKKLALRSIQPIGFM